MRYRIANVQPTKRKKTVIVFDNIAKLIFLRHLISERHFQFIAIVENFLPKNNLFELKAKLIPVATFILRRLKVNAVKNFLRSYCEQYRLDWTENRIKDLATLTDGYPLGIVETLKIISHK
jgi:hypothetical protein